MKTAGIFINLLKIFIYIGCTILFVLIMSDAWKKYTEKTTSTSSRYSSESVESKSLPCFTLQIVSAFKTRGFYYTDEDIRNNSFSAEDIFDPRTLSDLKIESQYWMKEYRSTFYGSSFTICPLKEVRPREFLIIRVSRKWTYKVYIHKRGEEFWINSKTNFMPPTSFIIDTTSDLAIFEADFMISESQTRVGNFPGARCKAYSENVTIESDYDGFTECSKEVFLSFAKSNINCSISGFFEFTNNIAGKSGCTDRTTAAHSYIALYEFMSKFTLKTEAFNCPLPCNTTTYNVQLNNIHINTFIDPFGQMKVDNNSTFILAFAYNFLEVQELVEILVYVFGDFLAVVGGNLGLALGFSCLSVLLVSVDFIQTSLFKIPL